MEDKVKRCNIHLIRVPEEIIENRRREMERDREKQRCKKGERDIE